MSESPSVFQSVVVAFLFLMFKIFHCQEVMGWILVSCQISGFASLFFFFFPQRIKGVQTSQYILILPFAFPIVLCPPFPPPFHFLSLDVVEQLWEALKRSSLVVGFFLFSLHQVSKVQESL